jgi:hypothetical protein
VPISPTLRPLLRDILGDEEQAIPDDLIQMVGNTLAQVNYLNAVLGEPNESNVYQFSRFDLN